LNEQTIVDLLFVFDIRQVPNLKILRKKSCVLVFRFGKIFHPFFRAKNVKNISGNELGLALTEKIIRIHQGTIFIESQLQKGKK